MAGVVIPGMPHHVTQRGNRREQAYFNDGPKGPGVFFRRRARPVAKTPAGKRLPTPWRSATETTRSTTFLERLESLVGRVLKPQNRGRNRKLPNLPK